jgi:hypothetical protein
MLLLHLFNYMLYMSCQLQFFLTNCSITVSFFYQFNLNFTYFFLVNLIYSLQAVFLCLFLEVSVHALLRYRHMDTMTQNILRTHNQATVHIDTTSKTNNKTRTLKARNK